MTNQQLTRRQVVGLLGGGAIGGLAGCTGDADDTGGDAGDSNAAGNGDDANGITAADVGSYAFELSYSADGEMSVTTDITGHRAANGDYYQHSVQNVGGMEMEVETYHVDGSAYQIQEFSGCQSIPSQEAAMESPYGLFATYDEFASAIGDTTTFDTTTVDGEEVYIVTYEQLVEVSPDDFEGGEETDATWYVSTETGYLLRSEYSIVEDGQTITGETSFHSFGDDFDIELPAEC